MKRIFLITLSALLVGCQSDVRGVTDPADILFSAATATTSTSVPLDLLVFVPCADGGAGELVQLTGFLLVLSHSTFNASGGFRVVSHFNPQGVSGVGLSTGLRYRGTGVTQESFGAGPGSTYSFVNSFQVIGQGPGNNFVVHQTVHLTVNAQGTVTAVVDEVRVECK